MEASANAHFDQNYQTHLKHLKLKGLQPKTIEAYSRAIRRIGKRFDHQIDDLTEQQLTDYFTELVASHSWSAVKLDLYGLKFYYAHVLRKPWVAPGLIKPPQEPAPARHRHRRGGPADLCRHPRASVTGCSSSRSTAWDCAWAKGCGFRSATSMPRAGACMCAMPRATGIASCPCRRRPINCCAASGRCIATPCCCFPIATAVCKGAASATTPLDRGGVQTHLARVIEACGLKKRSPHTACATAMPPT